METYLNNTDFYMHAIFEEAEFDFIHGSDSISNNFTNGIEKKKKQKLYSKLH